MNVLEQLMTYYAHNGSYVMDEFGRHFLMSAYGVLFAAVVGVPAGILIAHFRRLSAWVFAVTNVFQTIPALAMLAVLMLVMGLGANTVILSLFLYSLLPIIRNTYTGIISIEHAYLESGKAMGMTKFQVLRMVEPPARTFCHYGGPSHGSRHCHWNYSDRHICRCRRPWGHDRPRLKRDKRNCDYSSRSDTNCGDGGRGGFAHGLAGAGIKSGEEKRTGAKHVPSAA